MESHRPPDMPQEGNPADTFDASSIAGEEFLVTLPRTLNHLATE
jgi:hypothetical protein